MSELTPKFARGFAYCLEIHRDQKAKGKGTPYIAHLMAVAGLVLEAGGDEDEAIAALLHDSLEDQPQRVTPEEIRNRFGDRVLELVISCTDTPPDYSGGEKPPWKQRKEAYLQHLHTEANRVALADKLHNARQLLADYRSVGEQVWERFNAGKEEQLWYYQALTEAFKTGGMTGFMLRELEETVASLVDLARLE